MDGSDVNPPGFISLIRKFAATGMGALHNRGELFLVELREEENRLIELLIWVAAVCFLGMMFAVVLTATIIFLFPEEYRIYAAGGFCLLYLVGAVLALLNLKALLKSAAMPFQDSMEEVRKDRVWFESLK